MALPVLVKKKKKKNHNSRCDLKKDEAFFSLFLSTIEGG